VFFFLKIKTRFKNSRYDIDKIGVLNLKNRMFIFKSEKKNKIKKEVIGMADLVVWRPFQELRKEIDRLFNEFFSRPVLPEKFEWFEWTPAVDVSETEDSIIVKADLPGVKPEEIEINISDNILTIRGEKKREEEEKKENFYRVERYYGSFMRAIQLPTEVDVEKVKATYKDGVLKVVLPKKVEPKKTIKVEVEK
jgi:HSP20 family protein